MSPVFCPCCGHMDFGTSQVLDDALVEQWGLSNHERAYVDRQQGTWCLGCSSNLRSMSLGRAITRIHGFGGLMAQFAGAHPAHRVLEINEAGQLTQFLRPLPGHRLVEHPEVDMLALPFADGSFDLVVHSDTLEHLTDPVAGLRECHRVLRPGGWLAFTVPMIIGRLTRTRGPQEPESIHGGPANRWLVHTEYGADAWRHVVEAGFGGCGIETLDYPAGCAWVAQRDREPLPSAPP